MGHTGGVSDSLNIDIPRLHALQIQVIETALRFNVLVAGRRFGKDVLLEYLACAVLTMGGSVGVLFPSYRNLDRFWTSMKRRLGAVIDNGDDAVKSDQIKTITLANGGRLIMYSLKSIDDARGEKFNLFIFNEAGEIASSVALLSDVWDQIVRPTLIDFKGSAWFAGTPKGTGNDFYTVFNRGNSDEFPSWKSWQLSTLDNPYIDSAEVESMVKEEGLTETAISQEIYASFVEPRGQLFGNLDDVLRSVVVPEWSKGMLLVGGMDFGGATDYHVISVWDARKRREIFLDRFKGSSKSRVASRAVAVLDRYNLRRFVCEDNSRGLLYMQEIGDLLDKPREGRRVSSQVIRAFNTNNASKVGIVEALVDAFDRKACLVLPDSAARHELVNFSEQRTPNGLITYASGSKMVHDDTVIARTLAYQACRDEIPDDALAVGGKAGRVLRPYAAMPKDRYIANDSKTLPAYL